MSELVLDRVTVNRGAGPVIRDVSLRLTAGAITALVGPNGAGKTSLLEAISGVVPAAAGTIVMDGKPLDRISRVGRYRSGLAHIEQGRAVFADLTVTENLRLTTRNDAEVDRALEIFPELDKRRNSTANLLSGGEQQMLVLARSFAAEPRFLLIDEMSLGLAPVVFQRLLPFVQRFAEHGTGVLLVEQFTHMALGIATEAMVVSSGRVSYHGAAQPLRDSPATLHAAYLGG